MRCMAVGPAPSRAALCSARRPAQRARGIARAQQVAGQGKAFIDPVEKEAAAFAPATVANLGPGFDWMGCAVEVRSSHMAGFCVARVRSRQPRPAAWQAPGSGQQRGVQVQTCACLSTWRPPSAAAGAAARPCLCAMHSPPKTYASIFCSSRSLPAPRPAWLSRPPAGRR